MIVRYLLIPLIRLYKRALSPFPGERLPFRAVVLFLCDYLSPESRRSQGDLAFGRAAV